MKEWHLDLINGTVIKGPRPLWLGKQFVELGYAVKWSIPIFSLERKAWFTAPSFLTRGVHPMQKFPIPEELWETVLVQQAIQKLSS